MPLYLGSEEVQVNIDGVAYTVQYQSANEAASVSADQSDDPTIKNSTETILE